MFNVHSNPENSFICNCFSPAELIRSCVDGLLNIMNICNDLKQHTHPKNPPINSYALKTKEEQKTKASKEKNIEEEKEKPC